MYLALKAVVGKISSVTGTTSTSMMPGGVLMQIFAYSITILMV